MKSCLYFYQVRLSCRARARAHTHTHTHTHIYIYVYVCIYIVMLLHVAPMQFSNVTRRNSMSHEPQTIVSASLWIANAIFPCNVGHRSARLIDSPR